MAEIEFSAVDIYGSDPLKNRVAELVGNELGGTRSAETILQTIDFDSGTTKVFGGFVGGELVTMNAFMRTRFASSDGATKEEAIGYQSGFSATDANHRGKGYWPKLMAYAETELAGSGATFIFGFPNPVSHPLFVKKLGYSQLEFFNFRIACIPFLFGRALAANGVTSRAALDPSFSDVLAWKKRSDEDGAIISSETVDGRLWGKIRRRHKLGFPVKFLEVGTFDLKPGGNLASLLRNAAAAANAHFLYISMNPENDFFGALRHGNYGQPIIVKSLNDSFRSERPINFFGGMRDTF